MSSLSKANESKLFLTITGIDSNNIDVKSFSAVDAISQPYRVDVGFVMLGVAIAPDAANVLNKPCRLDILHNGETISYCGIAVEFRSSEENGTALYTLRIVPSICCLKFNISSRIFQGLTVPGIIRKIIEDAKLTEYFEVDIDEPDDVKYPKREYCVQYQESDFAFISRLMEDSGIWYYIEQVDHPGGSRERVVVTDKYSRYPQYGKGVPFMAGSGFSEKTPDGNIVESVKHLTTASMLMPERVRVRNYNHRTPEALPDCTATAPGGHCGIMYEFGGTPKNVSEAEHRAALYARRLWVEKNHGSGMSNVAPFRAGLRVSITNDRNGLLAGNYLLTSVKHEGGWINGAYTYRNEFSCVSAKDQIYAPIARTPVPRIDGVTTAPVGAGGDKVPTLNEKGYYNVNLPFALDENGREVKPKDGNDYGHSKHIRVAQPSGGITTYKEEDKKPNVLYGMHFPSKQGAEMVLAYIDGDPDKPVGIGFVPNGDAPSVVCNKNNAENLLRTWGGNELVMIDTHDNKSIKLSTPDKRYLELHDGDEAKGEGKRYVTLKSKDSKLHFNDTEKYAVLDIAGNKIHINYAADAPGLLIETVGEHRIKICDKDNFISVTTAKGIAMKMDDNGDTVTVQTSSAESSKAVLNGKDERITLTSKDSKVAIDGKEKMVAMENEDDKVILDSGSNSYIVDVKRDITFKTDGKIIFDAKQGVTNKGVTVKMDR